MYHWFSGYSGYGWTPRKGYNEAFSSIIHLLREWFGLSKVRPGHEDGSDKWINYHLQGQEVQIVVDTLDWGDYRDCGEYITPVLKLGVRIAKPNRRRRGGFAGFGGTVTRDWEVFFQNTVVIEFPNNYPSNPPRFRIDDRRYDVAQASHEHHMFEGGWFCILADESDWNSRSDTVVSGLNAAFDWIVWHNQRHGW